IEVPVYCTKSSIARPAAKLLPTLSNPGDQAHRLPTPGISATMPPPTPLFIGKPTRSAYSPAALYIPQVSINAITDCLCRKVSSERVSCEDGKSRLARVNELRAI